ncbi:MAG: hypothetical protein Q9218_002151 [Villophora microphyllina]
MAAMKHVFWIILLIQSLVAGALADRDSIAAVSSTSIAFQELQQVLLPDNKLAADVETVEDHQAAPQDPQILTWIYGKPSPVPTGLAIHETAFWGMSLGEALELAQTKATELDLAQVASDIETWVKHHPWKAAFYAASALTYFAPEILSIPALEALGFSLGGVRAGRFSPHPASRVQLLIEMVDV